jgi:4-amino-4-deoxy-L-arabinose transferase-like glycosyltransferase
MAAATPQPPAVVIGLGMLWHWLRRTRSGRPVLALLVMAPLAALWLAANGFCFSKLQFLSQQEAIDAWVDRYIGVRTYTLQVHHDDTGMLEFRPVKVIPYRDRADFYERNPSCCRTASRGEMLPFPGPPPLYWSDRLFGKAAYLVVANFAVNYIDTDGVAKSATEIAITPITNCGHPWRGY